MSGIIGILNLDGAPIDKSLLSKMTNSIAYRGPDAQKTWIDGCVGFGHTMLCTTPEAQYEIQPCSLDSIVWITFDGRIDNREELNNKLKHVAGRDLRESTDVDLILFAYRVWREDCVKHIVGDFAFAIWDKRTKKLFCVRDPVGVGSFHYAQLGQTIVFGTTLGSVLAGLPSVPKPNEAVIADFLLHRQERGNDQTPYQDVMRLPAGYKLVAKNGVVQRSRYYVLGAEQFPTYSNDSDYVDKFRELLTDAVICRLRSCTPVSMQVSGGLDSSSIACITNHLIETGKFSSQYPIQMQSCINPSLENMGEYEYQKSVIDTCNNLESVFIDSEQHWTFKDLGGDSNYPYHQPEPHPQRSWLLGNLRYAANNGSRVLLHGNGGDFVLGAHYAYWRPDILHDLTWRQQFRESPHFFKRSSVHRIIFDYFFKHVARKYLPEKMKDHVQFRKANTRSGWVNRKWAWDASIDAPYSPPLPPPQLSSIVGENIYRWFMSGWVSVWHTCNDTDGGYANVQWRDPFMDRRLIEFMLHVPTRIINNNGWTKNILRQAMSDLLPERVLWRTDSLDSSYTVSKGLQREERKRIEELMLKSRLIQNGWIDGGLWQTKWNSYQNGSNTDYQTLVDGICIESWIKYNYFDN